jgi:hypothetical protein
MYPDLTLEHIMYKCTLQAEYNARPQTPGHLQKKPSFTQLKALPFHITVIRKNLMFTCKFQHRIYYCDNELWENIAAGSHMIIHN